MAYVNQHLELFLAYKKAHPELRPQQSQINTNIIWKDAKKEFKRRKPDFTRYINGVIEELNRERENREAGVECKPQAPYIPQVTVKPQPPTCTYAPSTSVPGAYCMQPFALTALTTMTYDDPTKDIKFLQSNTTYDDLKSRYHIPPQIVPDLPSQDPPPEIVRVVAEIARLGGFIDALRCQELKRCCGAEDIARETPKFGLRFQNIGNYWHLLPVGFAPEQGLRYETTTPVKLCHGQTEKDHVDRKFSSSTIDSLECLASILGSRQVAYLYQDNRAKVPLGISAAVRQAPILMRMEYHDSPAQEAVTPLRHKFNLSVYAAVTISDDVLGSSTAVGSSGPTYVAVRTAKQRVPLSQPIANAADVERLMWIPSFQDVIRADGKVKPILMLTVSGGPDESVRYPKTIAQMIRIFRKYELDALFVAIPAPSRSINKTERRLSLLSRELFGIILPHDPFGLHLNDSGAIVDDELESRNLESAGRVLAETWSRFVIDGHPVLGEFLGQQPPEDHMNYHDSEWYSNHVRESQYFLQVVKCNNLNCCSPMRSNLRNVLPNGFFSAPYPFKRGSTGLWIPNSSVVTGSDDFAPFLVRQAINIKPSIVMATGDLPYDQFCPSVKTQVAERTCHLCGLYFSSKKNVQQHIREVHKVVTPATLKIRPRIILAHRRKEILCLIEDQITGAQNVDWLDEEDVDIVGLSIPEAPQSSVIPVIGDKLAEWVQFPWVADV